GLQRACLCRVLPGRLRAGDGMVPIGRRCGRLFGCVLANPAGVVSALFLLDRERGCRAVYRIYVRAQAAQTVREEAPYKFAAVECAIGRPARAIEARADDLAASA